METRIEELERIITQKLTKNRLEHQDYNIKGSFNFDKYKIKQKIYIIM